MKVRKRPVVVDAVRWTGTVTDELRALFGTMPIETLKRLRGLMLLVRTKEGQVFAAPGDWVIRGVVGELYPCANDVFEKTYEPAELLEVPEVALVEPVPEPIEEPPVGDSKPENVSTGPDVASDGLSARARRRAARRAQAAAKDAEAPTAPAAVRKTRLVDCNPKWGSAYGEHADGTDRYLTFDCPEGHPKCWHTVPFTPGLDGTETKRDGALWQRTGDAFESLTLSPSIRRIPNEVDACALHIHITNGQIEFCGDSK